MDKDITLERLARTVGVIVRSRFHTNCKTLQTLNATRWKHLFWRERSSDVYAVSDGIIAIYRMCLAMMTMMMRMVMIKEVGMYKRVQLIFVFCLSRKRKGV